MEIFDTEIGFVVGSLKSAAETDVTKKHCNLIVISNRT